MTNGPQVYKTVDVEIPPAWAIQLGEKLDGLSSQLRLIEGEVGIQSSTLQGLQKQLTGLDFRVVNLESRQGTTSIRVEAESQANMNQDAAIATLLTRSSTLEKTVTTLTDKVENTYDLVSGISKTTSSLINSPTARKIGTAIGALVLAYVTYTTAKIQAAAEHSRPAIERMSP